jgi:hypothetical protein
MQSGRGNLKPGNLSTPRWRQDEPFPIHDNRLLTFAESYRKDRMGVPTTHRFSGIVPPVIASSL